MNEELEPLAETALPVMAADRRKHARFPGQCTIYLHTQERISLIADIVDLSESGAGFLVRHLLVVESEIELALVSVNEPQAVMIPATIRSAIPTGDSVWRVGCQFGRRLKPEELAKFVA
jgi:hypothetical protein